MKSHFSFIATFCVLIFALFCGSTTAIAQQATARVLRADINGNQIHMYLDHDSLQSLINRTMSAMDANEDGALLEWSDALTNGNNPGMNVNYNGFSVYGIDSLTSTGLLTADSLISHKDAEIRGKLILGGNLDLDANLDMDGTTADFQASGAISLDAGAASNFTTSAGLTLEGGAGVTVTSTGGSMTLNGTGQTVDLDAATLDVDATTITVDATTSTFTCDVNGPRSTGDDEFVTYGQLDSLANTAPFNETYKVFKVSGAPSTQTIVGGGYPGNTERLLLLNDGGIYGYYTELSSAAEFPADPADQPFDVVTSPSHHMDLTDKGIYQFFFTLEVKNTTTTDAFVTVNIQNYDADELVFATLRTLSSESEVVYGTNSFGAGIGVGLSHHLNSGMSFECDNDNEDIQVEITVLPAGASIDIVSMSLSVSRVGEE